MKNLLKIAGLVLLLTACSKEKSIQKYFVDKHEDVDFTALDISTKTLFSNFEELTQEEKEQLKNISKLNVLVLNSSNQDKMNNEYKEVSQILNQSSYSSLIEVNSEDGSMMMNIEGNDVNNINELVFLGKNDEMGMIVARVLGKHINPTNFYQTMKMAEKMDTGILENFAKQFDLN